MSSVNIEQAPKGTKLWLLHLGYVEADEGFFLAGAGTSTMSNPNRENPRRKLVLTSALIDHPVEGLILFETGPGEAYPEVWGPPINDIFGRVDYSPEHELEAALAKSGHSIKDIKAVVMGHLHIDHAGGLEKFSGTDVPIYVHEEELKHAFYSVATKSDAGVYHGKDLDTKLNWTAIHGESFELAQGITLRHAPGHTPGLILMQANLPDSGTWLFTTDQYHVSENYEQSIPHGWLARDYHAWIKTHQMVKTIAKRTNANLVFGHDLGNFFQYEHAPHTYI
ncbi:N-acyl homoserine lactonase family protein [Aspergillus puulaauensis]|uniref:Metallo-beta-lactamase domain-containing protein n=1 Tax=Aspergillus puulaauensis TaxID=1220207 RepID=A0A7R8ANB2_9EURO|nr:uncharacterized protein APUU_40077S [Aspergillus puulaauensis]BCS23633.1 hypothetical protein APUU_40077S [Aspergillus puulaauensis]